MSNLAIVFVVGLMVVIQVLASAPQHQQHDTIAPQLRQGAQRHIETYQRSGHVLVHSDHPLHHFFDYFELLDDQHIASSPSRSKAARTRRSNSNSSTAGYGTPGSTILAVTTHNRTFHLSLAPDMDAFRFGMKAFSVDAKGQKSRIHLNPAEHLQGHLVGDPNARAVLHKGPQGLMGRVLINATHTIYFETAQRHFRGTMRQHTSIDVATATIAYMSTALRHHSHWSPDGSKPKLCGLDSNDGLGHRHSAGDVQRQDVNIDQQGDGLSNAIDDGAEQPFYNTLQEQLELAPNHAMRARRAALSSEDNTCLVKTFGCSRFHDDLGGNALTAANQIVSFIRLSDERFRSTVWSETDASVTHYGIATNDITVYESSDTDPFYNTSREAWVVRDMLVRLGSETQIGPCLSHLFTAYDFDGGVLGLAWVGASSGSSGVCSSSLSGPQLNTGLTTIRNFKATQPTLMLSLVTTHEIGHNWGSIHDPLTTECTPDEGDFVMATFAVDGSQTNNHKFSPCSRRSISNVITRPVINCWTPAPPGQCGDGILDDGEQCDAGFDGDACCTGQCELIQTCSDVNHPCCTNCEFDATKICFESFGTDPLCRASVQCGDQGNTNHTTCPEPAPKATGLSCTNLGTCVEVDEPADRCTPFCQRFHATSCQCASSTDECTLCCIHSNSTDAIPYCGKDFEWKTLLNTDTGSNVTACYEVTETGPVTNSTTTSTPLTPFQPAPGDEATCTPAYTVMDSADYDFVVNGDTGPALRVTKVALARTAGSGCTGGTCNQQATCQLRDSLRFANLLNSLTAESIARWAKSNLVGLTMLISCMGWLSVGLCVYHYEQKVRVDEYIRRRSSATALVALAE
eukprot:m.148604 g.148604  ORF g.148604 m.148604 type:complete len:856 (+) comp14188_c1_seq3:116-2683(+)